MIFFLGLLFWGSSQSTHAFTLMPSGSGGPLLGWTYSPLNFDYDFSQCGGANPQDAINTALQFWSNISSTSLRLGMGSTVSMTPAQADAQTTPSNPVIVCDQNFKNTLDPGNTTPGIEDVIPAYATLLLMDSGRHIVFGIININAQPGAKANLSSIDQRTLEIVLTHEMGHVLGLGHSPDLDSMMYYNVSNKTSLHLSLDDMNGITYLYPREEPNSGAFGCATVQDISGGSPPNGGHATDPASALEFLILFTICYLGLLTSKTVSQLRLVVQT